MNLTQAARVQTMNSHQRHLKPVAAKSTGSHQRTMVRGGQEEVIFTEGKWERIPRVTARLVAFMRLTVGLRGTLFCTIFIGTGHSELIPGWTREWHRPDYVSPLPNQRKWSLVLATPSTLSPNWLHLFGRLLIELFSVTSSQSTMCPAFISCGELTPVLWEPQLWPK